MCGGLKAEKHMGRPTVKETQNRYASMPILNRIVKRKSQLGTVATYALTCIVFSDVRGIDSKYRSFEPLGHIEPVHCRISAAAQSFKNTMYMRCVLLEG